MEPEVSNDRADDSLEAKARWYQSLWVEERMEVLVSMTDLLLSVNPSLAWKTLPSAAEQARRRIQVIEALDTRIREDGSKALPEGEE